MRPRFPEGTAVWIKRNIWLVACGVFAFLLVISVAYGVNQTQQTKLLIQRQTVQSNRHHAEVASQNDAILRVLNEHSSSLAAVKALQKEFTIFLNTAGPAVEQGQTTLQSEISQLDTLVGQLCTATPGCAK